MEERKRYTLLDIIRAVAIINMVFYHAMWDITRIFGVEAAWFSSDGAAVWQRSIRLTFILVSGFCWCLSKNKLNRALTVLAASVIISGVTAIVLPESAIIFGVLSLIGAAMLVTIPLDRLFRKISPFAGVAVCLALFILTRNIPQGYIGIGSITLFDLPDSLYANLITTFFGFRMNGFYSSDYVPLFPWLFIFWLGYFLYRIFERFDLLKYLSVVSFKPLEWLGRHSLTVYLLHQPIVYGILYVFFKII